MRPLRERVLEELARYTRGPGEGPQGDFERALASKPQQKANEALSAAVAACRSGGAYDTGRTQPLEAPPGWLPPVG